MFRYLPLVRRPLLYRCKSTVSKVSGVPAKVYSFDLDQWSDDAAGRADVELAKAVASMNSLNSSQEGPEIAWKPPKVVDDDDVIVSKVGYAVKRTGGVNSETSRYFKSGISEKLLDIPPTLPAIPTRTTLNKYLRDIAYRRYRKDPMRQMQSLVRSQLIELEMYLSLDSFNLTTLFFARRGNVPMLSTTISRFQQLGFVLSRDTYDIIFYCLKQAHSKGKLHSRSSLVSTALKEMTERLQLDTTTCKMLASMVDSPQQRLALLRSLSAEGLGLLECLPEIVDTICKECEYTSELEPVMEKVDAFLDVQEPSKKYQRDVVHCMASTLVNTGRVAKSQELLKSTPDLVSPRTLRLVLNRSGLDAAKDLLSWSQEHNIQPLQNLLDRLCYKHYTREALTDSERVSSGDPEYR